MFQNHLKVSLRNLWKNRLLSSLNLLGLSIGIGIRKVLGAGILKIVVLLSKDFIILVGLAAIIVFPIVWYVMNA